MEERDSLFKKDLHSLCHGGEGQERGKGRTREELAVGEEEAVEEGELAVGEGEAVDVEHTVREGSEQRSSLLRMERSGGGGARRRGGRPWRRGSSSLAREGG